MCRDTRMHCLPLLSLVKVEVLLMLELPSEPTFRSNVYNCIYRKRAYLDSFFPQQTGFSPPRPKLLRSLGPPELLFTGRLVAGQESANHG